MHGGSHAALPSSRNFGEVSRLAAAPRWPSTNGIYNDRWQRFAYWATGQGFDLLGPTAVQIQHRDSHASPQNIKSIPGKVKANEVRAVATALQLFKKEDLQAVMKAGRWSSEGTFTFFYLRDFCPQDDSLG